MTSKKPVNGRNKGASAERELARLIFDETGVKLIRNLEQSRGGGYDLVPSNEQEQGPVALSLSRYAIECKRYSAITPALLDRFWSQAERQAHVANKIPVLVYREDRREWRVMVPLSAVNGDVFGDWAGISWTADLSMTAFCGLVRNV